MNKTAVILALVLGICLVSALNSCKHDPIGKSGCTDINACNYDPDATVDNGSCTFEQFGYDCDGNVISMRTALDHAYECEAVLRPLPRFSCADAIEVPSTLNGIPQTYPVTEEGNGSPRPKRL